jgi:enoyl-CoA hydratase
LALRRHGVYYPATRRELAMSVVLVERLDHSAVITLNRPEQRNALSRELRTRLVEAFHSLAADASVRVLVLTGAGKAFCAGLDLKELGQLGVSAGGTGEDPDEVNVLKAMGAVPQPIIGAINGVTVTGGFEVALGCDVLIASSEARFADTHARVGILPGWGISQKLPRLIGISRAKELSFTGNYLSAEQAERWGLVNRVVSPQDLLPTCLELARDMASCVPEVLPKYKKLIDEGYALPFGDAMRLEARRSIEHSRSVTPEAIESRRAGIQKRGRSQTEA